MPGSSKRQSKWDLEEPQKGIWNRNSHGRLCQSDKSAHPSQISAITFCFCTFFCLKNQVIFYSGESKESFVALDSLEWLPMSTSVFIRFDALSSALEFSSLSFFFRNQRRLFIRFLIVSYTTRMPNKANFPTEVKSSFFADSCLRRLCLLWLRSCRGWDLLLIRNRGMYP